MNEQELASLVDLLLPYIGLLVIGSLVYLLLTLVGNWVLFMKAGEPGWKSIIPYYNLYTEFDLFWSTKAFWIIIGMAVLTGICSAMDHTVAGIISLILNLLVSVAYYIVLPIKVAKAFDRGILFGIGIILFQPIFKLILGLGNSYYQGPQ